MQEVRVDIPHLDDTIATPVNPYQSGATLVENDSFSRDAWIRQCIGLIIVVLLSVLTLVAVLSWVQYVFTPSSFEAIVNSTVVVSTPSAQGRGFK